MGMYNLPERQFLSSQAQPLVQAEPSEQVHK